MTTPRTPKKRTVDPIPVFKNYEEEAEFWDTHDVTDYWDQFKPVKVRFAKNLSEGITVRFDPVDMVALRSQAARTGVGPTTLVRMWVKERLAVDAKAAQPARTKPPTTTASTRPAATRRRGAG